MQVTNISSTTTPYVQTTGTQTKSASATPVAKTGSVRSTKVSASKTPISRATSSTTPTASTTIISNSSGKTSTVKCSSATIIATSSTTISYNSSSATVKAVSTGSSASTTINASATPTASATPYAYLAHMGGEAKQQIVQILKGIEIYNGNLENNQVDDKELESALKRFRDEFKVETTSLYSEEMVNAVKSISHSLANLSAVKTQLTELDFYDENGKEKIEATDISGKYITNNYVEGLRNFCRLYSVDFSISNMDNVLGKLKEVNDMYHKVMNNVENGIINDEDIENTQAKSFGKMWTFFKLGMGVSDKVAAALMGNSFAESRLNEGQVQSTVKDPDNYQYQLNDGVGYGLFQWTFPSRKNSLIEIAESMNMGINNINAQLETLKNEVLYSNDHKNMWIEMNNVNDCDKATTIFFDKFELVKDASLEFRIKAANDILAIMS